MTGYELLERELVKKYNASKISANRDLIYTIVELLAKDEEQKVGFDLINKRTETLNMKEYDNALKSKELRKKEGELKKKEVELSEKEASLSARESRVESMTKTLKECETARARDKIRLAYLFTEQTEGFNDRLALTRGLSNILGNGARDVVQSSFTGQPIVV